MAYKIKTKKKRAEEDAYVRIRTAYSYLDYEAKDEGWKSFGEAPEREQTKIAEKVSKKYIRIFSKKEKK